MNQTEEEEVGFIEKTKNFFKQRPVTPSKKADLFIEENLPDYIKRYKLAKRSDLGGVDKKVEEYVEEVSKMKQWKNKTDRRLEKNKRKVDRLLKKYGVEE